MKKVCCLCHEEFEGHGNNPWPVIEGENERCCDECNWKVVVPARVNMIEMENDEVHKG